MLPGTGNCEMTWSLIFLLDDDEAGISLAFTLFGKKKTTQRHSSLFASFWSMSAGKVSGFGVFCWQQILEYCPSWMRVPIFTFLGFCCYGGWCVGETADVFTGFLPRQWCAWGVCADGGRFFMCQPCCRYRCGKVLWWQCVRCQENWADLSAKIQAVFLVVPYHRWLLCTARMVA